MSTSASETGDQGADAGKARGRSPEASTSGRARHRARLDWRGKLSGTLLGFGVGMTVNLATDDLGYPGMISVVMVAAVLATASWLRRIPSQATLSRYSARILLSGAAAAVLVSFVVPAEARTWCLAAAAALTAAAVLLPADLATAADLLAGATEVGLGIAAGGLALGLFASGEVLFGSTLLGLGLSGVAYGVADLMNVATAKNLALVVAGVVLVGIGIAVMTRSRTFLARLQLRLDRVLDDQGDQ